MSHEGGDRHQFGGALWEVEDVVARDEVCAVVAPHVISYANGEGHSSGAHGHRHVPSTDGAWDERCIVRDETVRAGARTPLKAIGGDG